jgi:hypothetical protein
MTDMGDVRLCVVVTDGARCHLPELKIFKNSN